MVYNNISPVACVAALVVLQVIEEDHLMESARVVGAALKSQCEELIGKKIISVRGSGLFVGIELTDTLVAQHVVVGLLDKYRILASLDGPLDTVLVVKPPLVWTMKEVASFVQALKDLITTS